MSWLEKGIAALSPRWAAGRAFYRAQIEEAARAYDGARGGRRQASWSRPSTSANSEIAAAGGKLRDSARDLVRNNPWAKKAKRSYVSSMVGTGIRPRAATGNKGRDKRINAAFDQWSQECDADGLLDFYGLQGLVAGAMFESGEALTRFRDRLPSDQLAVPLQLQVLESDYLDVTRWGQPEGAAGSSNWVNQGIEFDAIGRRVAYYLWSQHPGDSAIVRLGALLKSSRVPADQIAHIFRPDRPGQIRGVTELAASMQRTYDLAEYEEATLVRNKIAACFTAFVKRAGSVTSPLGKATTDTVGRRLEKLAPGLIQYLGLDEEVQLASPPAADGGRDYTQAQLHAIAAGAGVTYEELTGDWSQVNYSSFRAGQLGYRRAVEMDQWLILIPMFCAPTWRRLVDRLAIAGVIDRPAYGVTWETPSWGSIDPEKDARSDLAERRAGFATMAQMIMRRGYDPDEVLEQLAAENKQLDDLGLVLDSDPRRVSNLGKAQVTKDTADNVAGDAGGSSNGGKGNENAQG
jgi:lambda family phage portal protein